MTKIFIVLSLALALGACTPGYSDQSANYSVMPPGLKDCKVYVLVGGNMSGVVTVVRCPNAETTTKSGKHSSVTIN